MIGILDFGDNVANVLPVLVGAVITIIVIILAGLSGLLVTVGFRGIVSVFGGKGGSRGRFAEYVKALMVFMGALLSLTFWIGLYVILFQTLSPTDFLRSLVLLLFPILGAFGILIVPGPDE